MARSGETANEFIQTSFSPVLAVLSASNVDKIVSKNNLSFVELLQPFLGLECEGQFREPNGTVCIVKNLRLIVRDVNWKPLQPTDARRQLNNAVLHNYHDKTVPIELEGRKLTIPHATTWFDSWRETYFEVQFPSDHEFTKHFLTCLCVATTCDENIIETYTNLNHQFTDLLSVAPPKLPKWFNSNVLKSYVLLHDISSVSKERADALFESMKQSFEPNSCFMLCINSRSAADQVFSMDYWAPYIKRNGRNAESSDFSSNSANAATSPLENPTLTDSAVSNTQEFSHPLTTNENEYDNANSLQTYPFSGSSESVNCVAKTSESSTEVHGAALNSNDLDAIKKFIQDYTAKALLPFIERQITVLSEAVANRKGVSRSLLSATKRWFGTGKGGNNTASNSVIYSSDCPELQLRRLGDLWFMCGQWQRAYDVYHTAKREFYADGAWLCYAGALEMAALSAFMAGEATRKSHAYMEESILTYLNTCRMVQYAVRATLLSALCLGGGGGGGLPGEAAKQLIRMTSEDSDLRSAMLLEQAALCFLAPAHAHAPAQRAMCRKYAFHVVLAGHRFSKAGQKKHAYRCYKQAYQVYERSGWRLATDHVQLSLGRLAGALGRARAAAAWLAAPLAPASPQPRALHRAALRDYMLAHQQWVDSSEVTSLAPLPLPLAEPGRTALVCAGPAPLSSPGRVPATSVSLQDNSSILDDKYWAKMEEMLLQVAKGSVPMIFKPTVSLFTAATDESPVVPQGEPIQISITLRNPLKVPLLLNDLELLWRFKPNSDASSDWLTNEPAVAAGTAVEANVIFGPKIKSFTLEGERTELVTFSLTPLQEGQLVGHGLAYKLINGGEENEGGQIITIKGKLNLEQADGGAASEAAPAPAARRLHITVAPCAPCLQVTFSESKKEVIDGELLKIDVEFRNVGPVDMRQLLVAVSHPDCLQLVPDCLPPGPDCLPPGPDCLPPGPDCLPLGTDSSHELCFDALLEDKFTDVPADLEDRAARAQMWLAACRRHVWRAGGGEGGLARGGSRRATLLLRPRRAAPALRLLAYYEPAASGAAAVDAARLPHRLLRHVFRFDVHEAVEVMATPRRTIDTSGSAVSEKMIIAVEIQNVSTDKFCTSVEILEASLLSKQWKLVELVAARDKNDALGPHEKLHIILEAVRITGGSNKIMPSGIKINKGDMLSQPDISVPPFSKFVLEYKTPFIEDEDFVRGKKSSGLIQTMLVVRWRARGGGGGGGALGQHPVWLDCFTAPAPAPALSTSAVPVDQAPMTAPFAKHRKANVVLLKIEHAHHVQHNFNAKRICIVPITINIVNCYAVPVNAYIEMSNKRDETCAVGWAGAMGGDAGAGVAVALQQFEARRVRVRALVAAPGSYLLGDAFSLSIRVAALPAPPAPPPSLAIPGLVSHLCADASLLVVQQV